jgi:hypothetical protein
MPGRATGRERRSEQHVGREVVGLGSRPGHSNQREPLQEHLTSRPLGGRPLHPESSRAVADGRSRTVMPSLVVAQG